MSAFGLTAELKCALNFQPGSSEFGHERPLAVAQGFLPMLQFSNQFKIITLNLDQFFQARSGRLFRLNGGKSAQRRFPVEVGQSTGANNAEPWAFNRSQIPRFSK